MGDSVGQRLYTVMLALSTAALIAGTWFEGLELSRYDWLFSQARVAANKPRPVIAAPVQPAEAKPEPVPDPVAAKGPAEPAAKSNAEPVPEPAAAKGPAEPAAKK